MCSVLMCMMRLHGGLNLGLTIYTCQGSKNVSLVLNTLDHSVFVGVLLGFRQDIHTPPY